jgi:hypothetical protein
MAMVDVNHDYRSSIKNSMQCLWNMTKESSAAFTNKPKKFGLYRVWAASSSKMRLQIAISTWDCVHACNAR